MPISNAPRPALLAFLAATALSLVAHAAPPAPPSLPPEVQAKIDAIKAAQAAQMAKIQRRLAINTASGEGRLREADKLARAQLADAEKAHGKEAPELFEPLQDAARQAEMLGDMKRALTLRERLVALANAKPPPLGADPRGERMMLALTLLRLGRQDEATKTLQAVVAEVRADKSLTPEKRAPTLMVAASLFNNLQLFGVAMRLYEEVLAAWTEAKGPGHIQTLNARLQIATMHWLRGDLKTARMAIEKALADAEAFAVGKDAAAGAVNPIALAHYRQMLANLCRLDGDEKAAAVEMEKARGYFEAEVEKSRVHIGKPTVMLAVVALTQLAGNHQQSRRWELAAKTYDEARKLATDAKVATTAWLEMHDQQRARMELDAGRIDRQPERLKTALTLLQPALERHRKNGGGIMALNPQMIAAEAHHELGQFAEAEALTRQTYETYLALWGERQAVVSVVLGQLADTQLAGGRARAAWKTLQKLPAPIDAQLAWVLSVGSEQERRQAIDGLGPQQDRVLSALDALTQAKVDKAATLDRFGYEMTLRHKGRLLDVLAQAMRRIKRRATPEVKALIARLQALRAELAALALLRPAPEERPAQLARIAALEAEARKLELAIANASPAFAAIGAPDDLTAVQKRIPEGFALVEYAFHHAHDPRHRAGAKPADAPAPEGRYQVFVLRKKGPIVRVDLGPAAPIDRAVRSFRKALQRPKIPGVTTRARALDRLIFEPVAAQLRGVKHVLVAPDAALDLVPFGALQAPDGQWRLQSTAFTYLSSGRDLLRTPDGKSKTGAVLLGDPSFGAAPATQNGTGGLGTANPLDTPGTQRSLDLHAMHWSALPGTAEEAKALAALLPGATLWLGEEASEQALKSIRAPALLHVATHGFFLPRQKEIPAESQQVPENPLIRSGLVLAGAQVFGLPGADLRRGDGVLTALEAGDLDLSGTRLVVLSACETAVGELRAGDGVQGLRRTLAIAGAETIVTSLWKVDDAATRDLMVRAYTALRSGAGRTDAFRAAQLEALASAKTKHPYFWAAFVVAGQHDAPAGALFSGAK